MDQYQQVGKEMISKNKLSYFHGIGLLISIILFVALLLFAIFTTERLIHDGFKAIHAKISLSDLADEVDTLANCRRSEQAIQDSCKSGNISDCSRLGTLCDVGGKSLDSINSQLESISNAMMLQEMTGLIGIFVTLSTIVVPLFVVLNLRSEKHEISKKMEKMEQFDEKFIEMKNQISEEVNVLNNKSKQHIREAQGQINKELSNIKEKERILASKLQDKAMGAILSATNARLSYLDIQSHDDLESLIRDSYKIEQGLILLLSNKDSSVKNGFNILRSYTSDKIVGNIIYAAVKEIGKQGFIGAGKGYKNEILKKFLGDTK